MKKLQQVDLQIKQIQARQMIKKKKLQLRQRKLKHGTTYKQMVQ